MILVFIIITSLMLLLHKLHLEQENFQSPQFQHAMGTWVTPVKGNFIARFRNLNCYTGWMSITFRIKINKTTPYWRNVFHMSESWKLEWNSNNNAGKLPYDWEQDLCRRPAVFITPNSYGLHICHDTNWSWNNPFDISIPSEAHIGLVWSTYYYYPNDLRVYCDVYVNNNYVRRFTYNTWLRQPDQDALLYFCDRFYGDGDFSIRDLQIFNYPLSAEQYRTVYQNSGMLKATPWKCINGLGAPMRLNSDGDVECLSQNNRDCMWGGECHTKLNTDPQSIKPLACGAMHLRTWGSSGYENYNHWCNVAKRNL